MDVFFPPFSSGRRAELPDPSPALALSYRFLISVTKPIVIAFSKCSQSSVLLKRSRSLYFLPSGTTPQGTLWSGKGNKGNIFLREELKCKGYLQEYHYRVIPDHFAGGMRLDNTLSVLVQTGSQELVRMKPVHGLLPCSAYIRLEKATDGKNIMM